MKKTRVFLLSLILVLSGLSFVFAQNPSNSSLGSSNRTILPSNDKERIELGFECLEKKAENCKDLSTQELALTILASPDKIFDDCVNELISRASANNFGDVRDTALAVLALEHAGKDTENYENWLLDQQKNPSELIWYLQQDSNEKVECSISYDSNSYAVVIGENKKINKNAGACLSRSQSNFWFKISPSCYDKKFQIRCNKDFVSSFLYKNQDSNTIYVLENTPSKPAYEIIELNLKSKCFGDSSKCNYEATAWATLALLKTKHEIDAFIPYLIALSDINKQYLPDAFIYLVTNYEDYANSLLEDQKLGNYWLAEKSVYGKFYDTSLALISLGRSSSEKIVNARKQLLFSQGSNGCWANSVMDTAMVLWALEGKSRPKNGGGGITYCTSANHFCLAKGECPVTDVLENYYCSGLSAECCKTENLKTCSEVGGQECRGNTICASNAKKTSDVRQCCLGKCEERNQLSECGDRGYSCRTSTCSSKQERVNYVCNQGKVCCRTKTDSGSSSSWTVTIILLIIGILAVILGIIFRKKLSLIGFKLKSKFGKDRGSKSSGPGSGSSPSRPGTAPYRRRMPPRRAIGPSRHHDKEFSDTFSKLKGFTK